MIVAFQLGGARALCPEALLGMLAPEAGLRGFTLFRFKNRWRPKTNRKKVFAVRLVGFWSKLGWRTNKMKKEGLHHKSEKLWFHFGIWCQPKWCRPKMVSLEVGLPSAPPPLATPLPLPPDYAYGTGCDCWNLFTILLQYSTIKQKYNCSCFFFNLARVLNKLFL